MNRGVYIAGFRDRDGRRLAYAVSADGRRLRELTIYGPEQEEAVVAALWDLLDAEDPTAGERREQLELVR